MSRDGNGTYTNPYPDFVAGTVISSDQVDSNNADIATALTQSIAVDGQSTITANIPMATYKLIGLGSGSAATDSLTLGQAQANGFTYQGTDSGAADAYVIALVPAITTQAAGLRVTFVAANASTGPSTLNAGGGADAIEYQGAALAGAEIAAGSTIVCEHDGTAWQMTSPSALALDSADLGVTVQGYDADTLFADVADVLTAGFATTPYNAGTKTTGTYTPDEANGNHQYAVNGGAHTLAPPTNNCTLIIQYTNDASAGTITTSGFTLVDGDTISTTDADDFFFYITKSNGFSLLTVKALQ